MAEPIKPVEVRTGTQILESIENLLMRNVQSVHPPRKRNSDELSELYKALADAQSKFKDVHKSRIIGGRNIPYATIDDLVEASRSALKACNLVTNTWLVNEGNGYSSLVTRLFHYPSGQWMDSELPLLNIDDEQKRGSSITYAWRYTYAPLLGLVDSSCDDDGEVTKQPIALKKF